MAKLADDEVAAMGGKLPLASGRLRREADDQRDYGEHASKCVEQRAVAEVAKRPTDYREDNEQ